MENMESQTVNQPWRHITALTITESYQPAVRCRYAAKIATWRPLASSRRWHLTNLCGSAYEVRQCDISLETPVK